MIDIIEQIKAKIKSIDKLYYISGGVLLICTVLAIILSVNNNKKTPNESTEKSTTAVTTIINEIEELESAEAEYIAEMNPGTADKEKIDEDDYKYYHEEELKVALVNISEEELEQFDTPLSDELDLYILQQCKIYNNVSPALVAGVISVESSFRNVGANKYNCVGYMQVCQTYTTRDMHDPYQNIKTGISMLSNYIDKYESINRALMVYNLGATGARKKWDEGIYTTKYTHKVIERAAKYGDIQGVISKDTDIPFDIETITTTKIVTTTETTTIPKGKQGVYRAKDNVKKVSERIASKENNAAEISKRTAEKKSNIAVVSNRTAEKLSKTTTKATTIEDKAANKAAEISRRSAEKVSRLRNNK